MPEGRILLIVSSLQANSIPPFSFVLIFHSFIQTILVAKYNLIENRFVSNSYMTVNDYYIFLMIIQSLFFVQSVWGVANHC